MTLKQINKEINDLQEQLMNLYRMRNSLRMEQKSIEATDVIVDTANRFDVSLSEANFLSRKSRYTAVRTVTAWRLRKLGLPLREIGEVMARVYGRKEPYHHATILNYVKVMESYSRLKDPESKEISIIASQTPEYKLHPHGI